MTEIDEVLFLGAYNLVELKLKKKNVDYDNF